jgi:hypothetical protein
VRAGYNVAIKQIKFSNRIERIFERISKEDYRPDPSNTVDYRWFSIFWNLGLGLKSKMKEITPDIRDYHKS